MVATVATEVNDEIVLFSDHIDEAIKGAADAFFGGFGVFDEGDVIRVEVVAGGQELDEGFGIMDGVVEFGAMKVVIDGDGQQVVGASGGGGGAALSVFGDEVAIGHEGVGLFWVNMGKKVGMCKWGRIGIGAAT